MRCSYCNQKIKGKKPVTSGIVASQEFNGDWEGEVVEKQINLCSWECAWAWGYKEHYPMPNKEIEQHLIKEHGYLPRNK